MVFAVGRHDLSLGDAVQSQVEGIRPRRAFTSTAAEEAQLGDGKNLVETGASVGSPNQLEGMGGDEKVAHVAKKAVKFQTYNSNPDVQVGDDMPFMRQTVVPGEPGACSSTVAPLTNSKKGGQRYSADDCGVTITCRTELRRAQVKTIPRVAVTGTWHVCVPSLSDVIADIGHCSLLRTKGHISP